MNRIAIVGAGLGGLTCARILQLHGRDVAVFEHEPSPEARPQGGTLDMHADTGQIALRAAGLFDAFHALSRPEGQQTRRLDHATATVLMDMKPEENDEFKPEIDRGQLRGLILDSLTAGTVRWGRSVKDTTLLEDGTRRLLFHDGTTEDFDLVVGADGAWSRVRAALTGAVPSYSGVSFVEIGFDDCDRLHPQLAELTGDGMMIAKSPGQAIIGQRNSNGHIRSYIAFREPENWYERAGLNQLTVGAYLLKKFEGWHESLRDFIALNEGGFINRPLYALPVPHSWERVPGITLLGDAAHLMPPLGLGANLAMLDGTELAQALVAEDVLDDGVRAYESTMLPRSVEAAKACEEGLYHLIPLPN